MQRRLLPALVKRQEIVGVFAVGFGLQAFGAAKAPERKNRLRNRRSVPAGEMCKLNNNIRILQFK